MRLGVLVFVCACFSERIESGGSAPAQETTGSPCTPGSENCACAPAGRCDPGLVCADAQCSRPPSTSTIGEATATSGESSDGGSTQTSSATATADTTGSTEVGSTEVDSTDTGSVCDGSCLECYTCAVSGPCAAEVAACEDGACGDTPFCMMSCSQQMFSCAECCDAASLGLAVDLVECFAAQCSLDCAFPC
ncbi:MAG: hypothetical protein IPK74_29865 [Deltaproteobacteria bacterium]|nr:hypothetical protein [Deltaproteobacteria bacterium]